MQNQPPASSPTAPKPRVESDDRLLLPGNHHLQRGYILAEGASFKVTCLGNNPGETRANSFDLRLTMKFPSGGQIILSPQFRIPVRAPGDEDRHTAAVTEAHILMACKSKAKGDLEHLASCSASHLHIYVDDKDPDNSSNLELIVAFEFQGQSGEVITRGSVTYHANTIPGFFVPGSGKCALEA